MGRQRGSSGVSERLGYEPNGTLWEERRGECRQKTRFLKTAEAWRAKLRLEVGIEGLEPCLPLLGL